MVKRCLDSVYYLIFVMAILSFLLLVFPMAFGIRTRVVISGSMEPEISVGSIAYISGRIQAEEIREQDVIAYKMGESTYILHRVIQVDKEGKTFRTKGDANSSEDLGEVEFSRYEGKEIFAIPYAGYFVKFFRSKQGILCMLAILALLVIADAGCQIRERRKVV